jgi:hypothetical protein
MPDESLWRCPKCDRAFANRSQTHACAGLHDLEHHFTARRRWLDGHVVLARRLEHPRFRRIETFSPRNHVHVFRLTQPNEVDAVFDAWMRERVRCHGELHVRIVGGLLVAHGAATEMRAASIEHTAHRTAGTLRRIRV